MPTQNNRISKSEMGIMFFSFIQCVHVVVTCCDPGDDEAVLFSRHFSDRSPVGIVKIQLHFHSYAPDGKAVTITIENKLSASQAPKYTKRIYTLLDQEV